VGQLSPYPVAGEAGRLALPPTFGLAAQ
jgi:hypothetical protein